MPRLPGAFYDERAGCWASSAIGELRVTRAGKPYRAKVFNKELTHPTRDRMAAQAWVQARLEAFAGAVVPESDLNFEGLSECYLQAAEGRLGPEAYDRANEHLTRFGNWPSAADPSRMDRRPARLVTRQDAERFRDAMLEGGASPSVRGGRAPEDAEGVLPLGLRGRARGSYPGSPCRPTRSPGWPIPRCRRRPPRRVDPVQVSRFLRWAWRRARGLGKGPNGARRASVVLLMTLRDTGRPAEGPVRRGVGRLGGARRRLGR
jgi:hypothetical protein